ncbi:hypothetical protein [Pseudomonas plecoglossicida]|uniref:hypothetical protein n=1 Tax=Pseudomonas plecoglossicida TaxID=70775 RepID=UPI0015E32284|nr:hypothetical protein [Pseudomonas plecoglossicida]MBA1322971.1 hypothetical protein [Pseudomonas plecoglossicida]
MHHKMKSAYDTASHAADLAAEFRRSVDAYLASGSFIQVEYFDYSSEEHVVALRRVAPMPSTFSNRAADIAINLRSALDQAAYAVSIAAGGAGKKTYFPFGKTLADVQRSAKGNSSEIPLEIFDYIMSFQPCSDGDFLLYALPEIGNAYKHREILRAKAVVRPQVKLDIRVGYSGPNDSIAFPIPRWDDKFSELVVCRYRGEQPDFQANVVAIVSFDVDGLDHLPADGYLLALSGKVSSILEGIEREALRVGLFS